MHAQSHPELGGAELGGRLPDGSSFQLDELERVSLWWPQPRESGADHTGQALRFEQIIGARDHREQIPSQGPIVDFDQELSSLLTSPVRGVRDQPAQNRPRPREDLGPGSEGMNPADHARECLVDQVLHQRFIPTASPRKCSEAGPHEVVNDGERFGVALRIASHGRIGRSRRRLACPRQLALSHDPADPSNRSATYRVVALRPHSSGPLVRRLVATRERSMLNVELVKRRKLDSDGWKSPGEKHPTTNSIWGGLGGRDHLCTS